MSHHTVVIKFPIIIDCHHTILTKSAPHWKRVEYTNTEGAVGKVLKIKPNVLICVPSPKASKINCAMSGVNTLNGPQLTV